MSRIFLQETGRYKVQPSFRSNGCAFILKQVASNDPLFGEKGEESWSDCLRVDQPPSEASREWFFETIDFPKRESINGIVFHYPGFQGKHPYDYTVTAKTFEEALKQFWYIHGIPMENVEMDNSFDSP